jgi:hypothetical protein
LPPLDEREHFYGGRVWRARLSHADLSNVGELLFFAYFAAAPLIVADDATRAMLCERGYNALSSAAG